MCSKFASKSTEEAKIIRRKSSVTKKQIWNWAQNYLTLVTDTFMLKSGISITQITVNTNFFFSPKEFVLSVLDCINIHTQIHKHTHIQTTYIYIYVYINITHIQTYTYIHIHKYIHTRPYIYIHTYLHIYTYTYIHHYIYYHIN